jgi:hypothetical protein
MSTEPITKDYFDAVITSLNGKIDHLRETVELKLDRIEEQTTRTNGRVTVLETKPHKIENCPQAELIGRLRDDMISNTAERKFTMKVAGAIATVISIIIGIVGLLIAA